VQPLVVIGQVQASTPLYVQVQVEPVQSASHRLPELSEHDEPHVVGAPPDPPADPNPEHERSDPEGRGMPGQTVSGTLLGPVPPPGFVTGTAVEGPTQFDRACSWASHPPTNCALPELSQVGCMPSMQRRNAYAADVHDGAMAGSCEQPDMQSFDPDEHPDCAIFWQMSAQEAETWAGVQLSPHEASGPAPSLPASVVRAPQPVVDANRIAAAPRTMHSFFMAIAQS